ncbi:hypothetical protein, partial [Devosia marina]|uniref:hypothetical protein n=1 Tax=Devosia marina TaxID=2683198 RepID=UPI0032EFC58D
GCRSYAPVDERKPDGSFAPGDLARCVHCKSVSKAPALGPASLHKGEVGQTLVGDELRGWIAYELTRRMVIDMPTARAAVDDAARRLEAVPPPRRQAAPITTDKSGPVLRETMWAKVIYEGEDNSFRFELNDEGNRDGPHYDRSIEFAADTFPAGTKIVVYEPDDEASPQPVTPSPKEVMVEAAPKSPFPAPLPVGVKVRDAVRQYLEQRTAAHEDGHTEKGSYFSTLDNLPDFVAAALSKPGEQG